MGSSKEETKTHSEQSPWAPQADALRSAFTQANGALSKASGATAPNDFVARMTPEQLSTFRSMLGYANGSNVAGANAATGDALAGAGTAGATGALSGLLNFKPAGGADQIIADANKYADNPAISGMVTAAMRDATQEARDVTNPAIDRAAAVTGNVNNSRVGLAQGLVDRGLAQKAADISANLRGAAYDKGLSLSSDNRQFDTSSVLNALQSAGSLGAGMAGAGVGARSASVDDTGKTFDIANMGGAGLQADTQAGFDNAAQRYSFEAGQPFDALSRYMQIIGGQNWGGVSDGTSTTTKTPSAFQVVGGLMGAGGSFFGRNGLNLFK